MKNRTTQKTCDCPMECTTISYSFRVVSTKFEDKEMCGETSENSVMNDFNLVGHKFPRQFIRKLIHLKNNSVSSNEVEYCKRNLQYRAEVIFRLATDSMSVTVMSRRLSFFDKMSAFGTYKYRQVGFIPMVTNATGGTLGLFTGISILSMMEVVFWVVRYLVTKARVGRENIEMTVK